MGQQEEYFITNCSLFRGQPVLFGKDRLDRSVAIRVHRFGFLLYVDHGFKSRQSTSHFIDTVLPSKCPFMDKIRVRVVHKQKMCSADTALAWLLEVEFWNYDDVHQITNFFIRTFSSKVYHQTIPPIIHFLAKSGIRCFSWVGVQHEKPVDDKWTSCYKEVISSVIKPLEAPIPPLTIAAFDIETDGLDATTDELRMISLVIEGGAQVLYSRHDFDTSETYDRVIVSDEVQLIERFVQALQDYKVTILTGWNIFGFDVKFIYDRLVFHGRQDVFQRMSWLVKKPLNPRMTKMSSNAFGFNEIFDDDIQGMILFDGYLFARKMTKKQKYSLAFMAEEIGLKKGDVSYEFLREAFLTKDPHMIGVSADYCMKDSQLIWPILKSLEAVPFVIEMTHLTCVPPTYMIRRGQGIITYGPLVVEAMRRDLVINPPPKKKGWGVTRGPRSSHPRVATIVLPWRYLISRVCTRAS